MTQRISDIPTHNATPGGTSKLEIENPTGPASEYTTVAEMFAANEKGVGLKYAFNSATSGDPGSGAYLFNNATFASATTWSISKTDGFAHDISALLATYDDSYGINKAQVTIIKGSGAFSTFYITGQLTDNTTYDTYTITPIVAVGTIANGDTVIATVDRLGDNLPSYVANKADPVLGIPNTINTGPSGGLFTGQRIFAAPFLLTNTTKFIGITAVTGGTLTSSPSFFFGLYSWSASGAKPVTDFGTVSQAVAASTKYDIDFTAPVTLPPGQYCLAFICNKTGSQSTTWHERTVIGDTFNIYSTITWKHPRVFASPNSGISGGLSAAIIASSGGAFIGVDDYSGSVIGQSNGIQFPCLLRYQAP